MMNLSNRAFVKGNHIFFIEYVKNFKHLLTAKAITKKEFKRRIKEDHKHSQANKDKFIKWLNNSDFKTIFLKSDSIIYWNY
ncbi:hypothetical protein [Wenyingzhuangia sp. 2_MG-2023]|uniref:hypothetical protein n=1 Tax=Wenyingzhuangia sp. 2_MG-2023 TaxID=3062639 RepID=UPI0026E3B022|nr:hypothetical protein [Wenyingzhuangia sp. 2_MG-2023]MDO6737063.1 hypothetical protein [Wenyingzhuangia sp. 2_MG-2023]